jgi:hypothetical protein
MSAYVECTGGIILTGGSRRSAILATVYPIQAGRGSKASLQSEAKNLNKNN